MGRVTFSAKTKTTASQSSPPTSYALRGGSVTHLQVINENRLHPGTTTTTTGQHRQQHHHRSSSSHQHSSSDASTISQRDENDHSWWPKGFENVGNTCYANAALQCLLSTSLPSALLNPKSAAVLRRYSSNGNLLAMGSGSVDSSDENEGDDSSSTQRRKLSKRERRRKEREDRRMHKTCQWLTKELKVITKDYITNTSTTPSSPLRSPTTATSLLSSCSSPPTTATGSPTTTMKVLDWLGSSLNNSGYYYSSRRRNTQMVVNPGSITRHPDHLSKCLRPYRQEDAHEFLRALLSTLVMNGHNKQLSSLFDGLLESAVTCQTCCKPSLTRDRYMDLSLDIHGDDIVSLVDALKEFTKTELLSGENKVFCQKCQRKRTATKGLRLATAPSILVCHLKRFAFDQYGNLVRLHKKVKFPTQLEIGDYMSKVNKSKPPPYELVGVLVHQGRTCDSGHYLAYTKCNGQWFKCNDSEVTKVDSQTVLEQQAYILMYEVAEMRKNHGGLKHRAKMMEESIRKDKKLRQANSSSGQHYPHHQNPQDKSTLLSLLCGVDVLEENTFLRDLCCRGPGDHMSVSVGPEGTGGVELVANLRDDATVASTVCDSTIESTIAETIESTIADTIESTTSSSKGSKNSPAAFRKSASSGNLQELEDDASKSYVCENEKKMPPRRRNSARSSSSSSSKRNNSHQHHDHQRVSESSSSDNIPEYNALCDTKWNAERISRHNWKYRDLPPLPKDHHNYTSSAAKQQQHPSHHRRRASSATPQKHLLL